MDLASYSEIPQYFFYPEIHQTDFFEIIFFSRGNGRLLLDHQEIPIRDQTIIFVTPYQKRQWYVDRDQVEGHFVAFQEAFLNTFFADQLFVFRLQYFYNQHYPLFLHPENNFFSKVTGLFQDIKQEIRNLRNDSQHLIRSLLYYLLVLLNRAYSDRYELSAGTRGNQTAYTFKQLLEQHVHKNLRVEDYANMLGVSRITLNKLTKRQFNLSSSEMIRQRLIHEIRNRLIYAHETIAEISYALNFSAPSHMTRFFRNQTGKTASDFRALYQGGGDGL